MRTLSIDIETYSPVDLTKSGVYVYAQHPEFEILLFGYSFDNDPVRVIDLTSGEKLPIDVEKALQDPQVLKTAHNALFERTCIVNYFKKWIPIEQWECTMVKGAMLGLPLALWAVGQVLRLPDQKMYEGKAIIRYFCLPCKPTKANGMRGRNLPEHEPAKWKLFKDYCKRDVEVEQAVRIKIKFFQIPEFEKKLYILDQEINDRGVLLDMDFVHNAIRMGDTVKERLVSEAFMLTGLEKANSAAQLKEWLSEEMEQEVDSLTKKAIPALMKDTSSAVVTRVLEIRQETSKTSVKKYSAMVEAVCQDGRLRGLFQFYGANRTGRWAGRILNPQNLPQNHLSDLDLARQLVAENDLEMLELMFGNVPDTLSQLIRTAIIPKPGHTFIVADFSAIEARVIAWLAGEKWRLDVFNSHGKIYEASASKMFKVPIEQVTKGSKLRQAGKVAELACIAEGQLVFTNDGLVPIQHITTKHLLWDGQQFVSHQGLIFKGIKNTITYEGLTATPDHLVWIKGQPEPVRFEYAASSGAHLLHPSIGGICFRSGEDNISRKKMGERVEASKSLNRVPFLPLHAVDNIIEPYTWFVKRLSAMLSAKANTCLAGQKVNSSKTTLRKPKGPRLFQLWRKGNSVQVRVCHGGRPVYDQNLWSAGQILRNRQGRQHGALRKREYEVCNSKSESSKQTTECNTGLDSRGLALCPVSSNPKTIFGTDKGASYSGSCTSCYNEKKELENNSIETGVIEKKKFEGESKRTRVYDILNSGPNNRYTVSGVLVHNCGYGGGVGALAAMGALDMGLEENELQGIINNWRAANPRIVDLWKDTNDAAVKAIKTGETVPFHHGMKVHTANNILYITLPSGRALAYLRPRMGKNRFGGDSILYEGMNQTTKKWEVQETYGAKLVENIVQAIARDCLAVAMMRVYTAGYGIVMHVHDEIVIEEFKHKADLEKVCSLMGKPIDWAKGLPLRADGYTTGYYCKG